MATTLYFRAAASDFGTGHNDAKLNTVASTWEALSLSLTRGGAATSRAATTPAGPTNGVEVAIGTAQTTVWYSPPLDADITISGSVTWNLRAAISAMTVNGAVNGRLEVIDGATGTITLIDQTNNNVEAGTTETLKNFAETPGAGVACKRGDRLRVRVFFDDSVDGNMAAGTATFWYDGPTGSATGDSFLTLTENLTFISEPAGTTIYPTDTASAVSTASVDREAWTSRGAGVQTDVTNTAAGFTAPIQYTDTAGGTVVDWFTKQLAAFTLGGAVRVNARVGTNDGSSLGVVRCEIARVASDGTSATVWGATTNALYNGYGAAEAARSFLVSGDDLAVSDGQRLRIRFYVDDGGRALLTSKTHTLYYAGTSGGASGDTYLTFTQTLTEYVPNVTVTPTTAALVATKYAPTVTASDHQFVTVPAYVGSVTYDAAVTADSPVAFWKFGDSSGNPQDSAGTNHVTVVGGTPTYSVTGAVADGSTAIQLDRASSEYFTAPDHASLDVGDGPFTVEFIAKRNTVGIWAQVLDKASPSFSIYFYTDNLLHAESHGVGDWVASTPADTNTAAFHHWVVTKNANSDSHIYRDGVDVTGTTTNRTLVDGAGAMYIGAYNTASAPTAGSYFDGVIQKIAVYKSVLSPTRVAAHNSAISGAGGGLALTRYAPTVTVAAAADPQLVTPTTAALTATKYAPTVTATDNQLVTPTTKAAVLATFAPTVTASDFQLVTPTTKALTLTTFAPTVSTPERATPSTVSLALTTFAPSISVTDNQAVTPTTKALALATFAPTVTATDPQLVTPTTKALTLTTFAPTVTAAAHQQATPSTTALSVQAFAPTVTATDQQAVTPTTKALTLATFAPTVSTPQTVTPATKTLALTTFAPTVTNPDPQLVTPTTTALTLTKYAPSVGVSDAASIVPSNASLSLTTYAPTVIQPDPQLVTPTTPALELHTFAPVVTATAHQAVTPTTAVLVTARMVPTVTATANQSAIPSTKALSLTSYAPQVTVNNIVATGTIGLTLTTFAPSVTAGTNTYAFPDPASLTLTGYAPFIDLSAFKLLTPATAVLVLTTYPPTAEQHSITPLPTPIYGFAIVATGPGAGVEGGNGGATVTASGRGSTTVRTSGPSAKVTIR